MTHLAVTHLAVTHLAAVPCRWTLQAKGHNTMLPRCASSADKVGRQVSILSIAQGLCFRVQLLAMYTLDPKHSSQQC